MKKRLALTATFLVALSGCAEEEAREPGSFFGDGCVLDLETPLCENCLDFAHVTRLGGDELGPGFLVAEGTMDNVVRDSLGNDSGILRSFGAGDERNSDSPESMPVELTLAADADGSVFAARRFEYVVEVWSQEGSRLGGLRGEPLLNSANFLLEPASPDNPPPNIIGQIRTDSDGLLWVSLAARRSDWLETLIPDPSGDGFIEPALEDITGIFQGRLDVIDLSTCTLVASQLHDQLLLLLEDRTVLGYGFTELGANTLDVLRVWLDR